MAGYIVIDHVKYPLLKKKERKTMQQMVMDNKDTHLHVNKLYIQLLPSVQQNKHEFSCNFNF